MAQSKRPTEKSNPRIYVNLTRNFKQGISFHSFIKSLCLISPEKDIALAPEFLLFPYDNPQESRPFTPQGALCTGQLKSHSKPRLAARQNTRGA